MKSKVKSLSVSRQIFNNNSSQDNDSESYLVEKSCFDEQGRPVFAAKYNADGILEEKTTYSYENNFTTMLYYVDEDEVSEKTILESDEKGNVLKKNKNYADGSSSVSVYEYENDKPVKKSVIDIEEEGEEESSHSIWEYDEGGNLVSEEEYEYGELVFYRKMKYDDKNQLVYKETFYASDGKPSKEEYFWDNENISKRVVTNIYGEKAEATYKSDSSNQVIQVDYKSAKSITSTFIEYDEKGNAVRECEKNLDGEVIMEVIRVYDNDKDLIISEETRVFGLGRGFDSHYKLNYTYEFH